MGIPTFRSRPLGPQGREQSPAVVSGIRLGEASGAWGHDKDTCSPVTLQGSGHAPQARVLPCPMLGRTSLRLSSLCWPQGHGRAQLSACAEQTARLLVRGGGAASPGAEWSLKEALTSGKCSTTGASGQAGSEKRWHSRGWRRSLGLGSTRGNGSPRARKSSSVCCSTWWGGGTQREHRLLLGHPMSAL